ncbi:carbonic anhydrase [Blastochloris viridis]|uniref:Carbonic anhydrase n=1 Tax=Blastochloris viridis TaxID=1079 RepID=A0A0H5B9V5_BLAVI|nr:carbonic anhydrase [Blastochloris viridis]ALK11057.1 Carbonic anhydrase 1 [Blastochloris viridis]BAR98955.1 carbonic anhydrase [Blastochloris viridis]CUU43719.1 Carbonic anhydrase [Blastochloris viridis]
MTHAAFPERLIAGYQSFLDRRYAEQREQYEVLAKGQSPKLMVIACCDSRVSPTVIFDAMPGELFTVRNVANLVPPYEPGGHHAASSALEYAVLGLKVEHIVVLGHASCGGVMSYARRHTDLSASDFIGHWMAILEPAAAAEGIMPATDLPDEAVTRLERSGVRQSLANLMTFPWVRDRVKTGRLFLHGAYFAIATGMLERLDPATDRFVPMGTRNPFRAEAVDVDGG